MSARSRQHISISKVQDIGVSTVRQIQIDPAYSTDQNNAKLKPEFDIKTMEERYVLIERSKIRYKNELKIVYPREARRLGLHGYLIGMIDILPGGKMDKVFFPFAVPDKFFEEAAESALKEAEFEMADGQPITKKTMVCQEISFRIGND